MNISRPFILRPVATTLAMVALLLCGLIAYRWLPVSSLPEVDYPTIQTTTFYPGASPEVMAALVTSPLERQFGQMPGLRQMTSSSTTGASSITLQFALSLAFQFDVYISDEVTSTGDAIFQRKAAAQAAIQKGSLKLLPDSDDEKDWVADYAAMRDMFFSKSGPMTSIMVPNSGEGFWREVFRTSGYYGAAARSFVERAM